MSRRDSVSALPDLMKEVFGDGKVAICFCTLCSHQESYGHCYACPCGNHQPASELSSVNEKKLMSTVSHLIRLLHSIAKREQP
jgi:hypothetical protein